jgi:hypothetical protein
MANAAEPDAGNTYTQVLAKAKAWRAGFWVLPNSCCLPLLTLFVGCVAVLDSFYEERLALIHSV